MAALRWYDFRSAGGASISVKARSEAEAREEAAERMGVAEDEITCVAHHAFGSQWVPKAEYSR